MGDSVEISAVSALLPAVFLFHDHSYYSSLAHRLAYLCCYFSSILKAVVCFHWPTPGTGCIVPKVSEKTTRSVVEKHIFSWETVAIFRNELTRSCRESWHVHIRHRIKVARIGYKNTQSWRLVARFSSLGISVKVNVNKGGSWDFVKLVKRGEWKSIIGRFLCFKHQVTWNCNTLASRWNSVPRWLALVCTSRMCHKSTGSASCYSWCEIKRSPCLGNKFSFTSSNSSALRTRIHYSSIFNAGLK